MNSCIATAKKTLFIVAHQDDEVFIVSRMLKHLNEGDQVFVLWTAASYQKGADFKNIRIQESKTLMKKLEIPEDQFYFLMYPDGRTHHFIHKIVAELGQKIQEIWPDIVYIPAYEGGHIDHDIAHYCAVQAIRQFKPGVEVYEFPEYSGYATPMGLLPLRMRCYPETLNTLCRTLSKEEYGFVLDCWKIFESQYFPLKLYVDLSVANHRTFGIEYIRPLAHYNYLEIPPTQKVAYERYLDVKFSDFRQAVEHYADQ